MSLARRPVLLVLAGLAFAVLLTLGSWQVKRLQWKTDLIAKVEARTEAPPVSLGEALSRFRAGEDIEYLPVAVTGGFPSDRTAHVFGTYDGVPGYYVFQAFLPDDARDRPLLVNRGFVPQDDRAPRYPLPDADRLTGLVRLYEGPGGLAEAVAPAGSTGEGVFYARDREQLAAYTLPDMADAFLPIALDSTLKTDLPRGGTTRLSFRNAHLGYAITWYGLAASLVAVVVLMVRRREG